MQQYREGQTATNPQTGQRVQFRGGRWVSMGSPLQVDGPALRGSSRDQEQLRNAAMEAQQASGAARDAREFLSINRNEPTGGLRGLPLVQDVVGMFDPEFARMRSIQERLTPSQREAGSGAMSDRDVEMYRRATLNVGTPGNANARNAAVIQASARNAQEHAAFLDAFARANRGSTVGATEKWMEYSNANPLFSDDGRPFTSRRSWREHFGMGGAPARPQQRQPALPAGQRVRRFNPATGRLE